jgi:hypothetical protein
MAPSSSRVDAGGTSVEHLVVPMHLRAKLGENASEDLVDMFSAYQQFATDRYERRLTQVEAGLRQEFRDGLAGIRVEIAESKADLLRANLLMWMTQFAGLAGLIVWLTQKH